MGPPSSGRCPVDQVSVKLEPDRASATAVTGRGDGLRGGGRGGAPGRWPTAVPTSDATDEKAQADRQRRSERPGRGRHAAAPMVGHMSAVVAGPIHEMPIGSDSRQVVGGLRFARPVTTGTGLARTRGGSRSGSPASPSRAPAARAEGAAPPAGVEPAT